MPFFLTSPAPHAERTCRIRADGILLSLPLFATRQIGKTEKMRPDNTETPAPDGARTGGGGGGRQTTKRRTSIQLFWHVTGPNTRIHESLLKQVGIVYLRSKMGGNLTFPTRPSTCWGCYHSDAVNPRRQREPTEFLAEYKRVTFTPIDPRHPPEATDPDRRYWTGTSAASAEEQQEAGLSAGRWYRHRYKACEGCVRNHAGWFRYVPGGWMESAK